MSNSAGSMAITPCLNPVHRSPRRRSISRGWRWCRGRWYRQPAIKRLPQQRSRFRCHHARPRGPRLSRAGRQLFAGVPRSPREAGGHSPIGWGQAVFLGIALKKFSEGQEGRRPSWLSNKRSKVCSAIISCRLLQLNGVVSSSWSISEKYGYDKQPAHHFTRYAGCLAHICYSRPMKCQ